MIVEAEAGTAQWIAARRGCLTASRVADAISKTKKGEYTAERQKLLFELLAERMTGVKVSQYVTDAMQHGIDNQAGAIERYETETGTLVGPEVFVLHPRIEFFGATPDGILPDGLGLVEVKCPSTVKHLAWMKEGVVPHEYRPQMLAQLACTGRRYVDFISFDPRIQIDSAQFFLRRFEPKPEEIEEVEAEAQKFLQELEAMFEQITGVES